MESISLHFLPSKGIYQLLFLRHMINLNSAIHVIMNLLYQLYSMTFMRYLMDQLIWLGKNTTLHTVYMLWILYRACIEVMARMDIREASFTQVQLLTS